MGMKVNSPATKQGKASAGNKSPIRPAFVVVVKEDSDSQAEEDAEILEKAEKIKKKPARYAKAKKAMED